MNKRIRRENEGQFVPPCLLSYTIIAKKLKDADTKTIYLRARSTVNPNATCTATVIIDCVVKKMQFVSSALTRTNKADRGDEPIFKLINDQVSYRKGLPW